MKVDQIQLGLPPEMILLIRISSAAGNTQHLLVSAAASRVTVRRREQTVPGRIFVPFLILYGTCYVRHLVPPDCIMNGPAGESQRVTHASFRDTLIINHPLITHLLFVLILF